MAIEVMKNCTRAGRQAGFIRKREERRTAGFKDGKTVKTNTLNTQLAR
jgi:hypothetical protein